MFTELVSVYLPKHFIAENIANSTEEQGKKGKLHSQGEELMLSIFFLWGDGGGAVLVFALYPHCFSLERSSMDILT